MSQSRIKWGILGTSFISTTMADAIQNAEFGELTAIGSRSAASAKAFAQQFAIPKFYASHQEVLDDPEIDAIYIGLPNHLHKEWMIRCAQAGKHILCEKPLTTSLAEAQEALAEVHAAGVFCMEALMYRCHPLIAKLSEVIKQNTIGDIKHINAVYTANIAHLANPIAGGSILNLGCYPVSLVRMLVGLHLGNNFAEPVEMKAMGRLNSNNRDNQASVLLKFENNIMASVSTADDMEMNYQFEIYGSKGRLRFITNPWLPTQDDNRFDVYLYDQDVSHEISVKADKPLYTYQIDAVSQHILSGDRQSYFISWQDSIGNMTVLHSWLQQILLHAEQNESNAMMDKEAI